MIKLKFSNVYRSYFFDIDDFQSYKDAVCKCWQFESHVQKPIALVCSVEVKGCWHQIDGIYVDCELHAQEIENHFRRINSQLKEKKILSGMGSASNLLDGRVQFEETKTLAPRKNFLKIVRS